MTWSFNRSTTLTLGAALSAAIVALFFFHAPPIAVVLGSAGAAWLILRRKRDAE